MSYDASIWAHQCLSIAIVCTFAAVNLLPEDRRRFLRGHVSFAAKLEVTRGPKTAACCAYVLIVVPGEVDGPRFTDPTLSRRCNATARYASLVDSVFLGYYRSIGLPTLNMIIFNY